MTRRMPRSRETHTKAGSQEQLVSVHMMLPKAAVQEMKEMERNHLHTKEEVFLAGIRICSEQ